MAVAALAVSVVALVAVVGQALFARRQAAAAGQQAEATSRGAAAALRQAEAAEQNLELIKDQLETEQQATKRQLAAEQEEKQRRDTARLTVESVKREPGGFEERRDYSITLRNTADGAAFHIYAWLVGSPDKSADAISTQAEFPAVMPTERTSAIVSLEVEPHEISGTAYVVMLWKDQASLSSERFPRVSLSDYKVHL